MEETRTIQLNELQDEEAMNLVGAEDRNLRILHDCFAHEVSFRDNTFTIRDCDEQTASRIQNVILALYALAKKNQVITKQDVYYACRLAARDEEISFAEYSSYLVGRTLTGKPIAPKTRGQYDFVKAMDTGTVTFAIGPAGTGKTFLAVVRAVTALKKGDVQRIVLTRPAVEAGESLGFLPGDMKEKVDPYLTPLYDALHCMLGVEKTDGLIEKGTVEIAPLAYMRGRTLDDSFVILDEAQNTTPAQMKMFLTRLGFHGHMVITGDVTQMDLKGVKESGLSQAARLLEGIDEIQVVHLSSDDVVRHPLVQRIIDRYSKENEA